MAVTSDGEPSGEAQEVLVEYGKCRRYPPQFFYETLNGEWPVVHETSVCGEYRVAGDNPYV